MSSLITIIDGEPSSYKDSFNRILNTKLHRAGLTRQECLTIDLGVNVAKAWEGKRPTQALLDARNSLLEELQKSQESKVIICLGANALWALTGHSSLGKWRGTVFPFHLPNGHFVHVIATYHPSSILRQWNFGTVMEYDLNKAYKYANVPNYAQDNTVIRRFIIEPSLGQVSDYIRENWGKDVSFDIETAHGNITCISLATNKWEAISIPTTKTYWKNISTLHYVLNAIEAFLNQPDILKIGQNITFDIQYLMRLFSILPSKPWFDTMIAQHACYSELPKSLAFLTSIYTHEPYYKDDLKVWQVEMTDMHKLWEYNARDAAVTYEVKEALVKEMEELKVTHTYNYMIDLLEPLLFMMLKGLRFDETKRQHYKETLILQLEQKMKDIQNEFGGVNPNSPKQVNELIKSLGLQPIINKKTGMPTTNKRAMQKLSAKSPSLMKITEAKEERTLISNYLELEVDATDGRLRCSLNSTGTETGRLSSSESVFGGGRNLQNFPKKVRDMIIPDEGLMFTEVDLKGAEARIVAYLCLDEPLIKLLENDGNVHNHTAKLIWKGLTDEQIKQDQKECEARGEATKSKYYIAKRIRHSCNYIGTWVTVSEQLGITAAEAKKLLQAYYDSNPNLTRWHRAVEDKIKRDKVIVSIMGRKRIFFDRIGNSLIKEAVAYNPQETVAHILNLGLMNVYNELCKHPQIDIMLQVHDSLLIQHPVEMKEELHTKLPQLMRIDIKIHGRDMFIPIDIKSGPNWRDLK